MVRFGIVGSNFIVDAFIAAAKLDPRLSINAIYSRSQERADQFASKYDIANTYTNISEMASDGKIDAVYIASPNALHFEQAKVFLEAKIPVICEKPFCSNAKQSEELIELSKANNTPILHAIKNMFEPRIAKAAELLDEIGPVRMINAARSQYSSRYDAYKAGITENAFKPELANGAAMDLGIYLIQPLVAFFGVPKQILAMANLLDSGADGNGVIIAKYDEMIAQLSFGKISNSYIGTEIQGENGTIFIDTPRSSRNVKVISNSGAEKVFDMKETAHPMVYEISSFIDQINSRSHENKHAPHSDNIAAMRILDEYRRQVGMNCNF